MSNGEEDTCRMCHNGASSASSWKGSRLLRSVPANKTGSCDTTEMLARSCFKLSRTVSTPSARRRIHACHLRRRIHACHLRRRKQT